MYLWGHCSLIFESKLLFIRHILDSMLVTLQSLKASKIMLEKGKMSGKFGPNDALSIDGDKNLF